MKRKTSPASGRGNKMLQIGDFVKGKLIFNLHHPFRFKARWNVTQPNASAGEGN
jgi:hypothetical protein